MRGLSRRKAVRARKRDLQLPADDGLVPVPVWKVTKAGWQRRIELQTPEQISAVAAATMAPHDKREPYERWGGNQWGEEWVTKEWTRELYARDMPLLKTDLPYSTWWNAIRRRLTAKRRP